MTTPTYSRLIMGTRAFKTGRRTNPDEGDYGKCSIPASPLGEVAISVDQHVSLNGDGELPQLPTPPTPAYFQSEGDTSHAARDSNPFVGAWHIRQSNQAATSNMFGFALDIRCQILHTAGIRAGTRVVPSMQAMRSGGTASSTLARFQVDFYDIDKNLLTSQSTTLDPITTSYGLHEWVGGPIAPADSHYIIVWFGRISIGGSSGVIDYDALSVVLS